MLPSPGFREEAAAKFSVYASSQLGPGIFI
jgi:hypothetical protein